jgi:predicted RNA-binding protein (virulence factor B family)
MNDLVVSHRQKHNDMSWSGSGSVLLASIEVLKRNREWAKWFEEGDLEFKLAA